ncbi:glycogen debranching enzyme N-terminal domain-containing protein [bacterium]|nr:glycogen debranching enzyme N-terminal domain-containing protein [bacterium]
MKESLDPAFLESEWLEADGLGGYASGTVSGIRTRRYHALLISATRPPDGKMALVKGLDAWLESDGGKIFLSRQHYDGDPPLPENTAAICDFQAHPWPKWVYRSAEGYEVEQELFMRHGESSIHLSWKITKGPSGPVKLVVRPFFSVSDFHALHHANPDFHFKAQEQDGKFLWSPYDGVPGIIAKSNGKYGADTQWYRNFSYREELARGLDHLEDLASPGLFTYDLSTKVEAELSFAFSGDGKALSKSFKATKNGELKRRAAFESPIHRAADLYQVKRGAGSTIIAGYHWFGDWGRDTFISMRGILLAEGRFQEARDILIEWSGTVKGGLLPNRFPDYGEELEYNSVDAALWFVVAAYEYLQAQPDAKKGDVKKLHAAIDSILTGYSEGTLFRIYEDADGLLACGVPKLQLTWMDAKVGDWVVTPRIGKPVEIQALWINALTIGAMFNPQWKATKEKAQESFEKKFWNESKSALYDVIDVDHQPDVYDDSIRPNQIFTIGGLPFSVISGERASSVLKIVEEELLTPYGLRSLSPNSPDYQGRYEGGILQRDGAYHQGTVWGWLIGPFVEAFLRVNGDSKVERKAAKARFLEPLHEQQLRSRKHPLSLTDL